MTAANDPQNATVYVEDTDPHEHQHKHGPRNDIPGWGADLDKANRPAVPMERTPPRLPNVHWTRPEEQPNRGVEVLHSTERPGLTPVYGTTCPPRGLSGVIRRFAFTFSENDLRRWMILLVADRVDMGEGILDDLAHGHVPNFFKEMGLASEWRYNRAGFMQKALVIGALTTLAIYLLRRDRRYDD